MTRPANPAFDEILSIPGNRPVYDALAAALREGEAIAFVGAGASAGMYPLWNEFIERLADYAVVEGKAEPKDAGRWTADTTATPQQRVSVILRRLGEPLYRNFLKDTFGPRRGPDGRRYAAAHAALLRLPFRGYVTTNYDPALEFARMDLRPDCLTTGTPTWRDDDEVYRWYTGDVFARADDCPILWLHGYWQRPNDIVLNSGEYSAAYKPGLYRNLLNALWGHRHLVFVGFGFNDPQFTFMVGEYLRDIENPHALPRHFAVLALPVGEDGARPDADAVREWRDNLEADYHVRPLFYPERGGDHSALRVLLDALAAHYDAAPSAAGDQPAATAATPARPFDARWVHDTPDDDRFVGREDELARLDRWVRAAEVRAVGIAGVGGTGKSALVGHWLKQTEGWRSRPFEGLFAWNFYQDRDADKFLRQFLLWAHESLGAPEPDQQKGLVDGALGVLRARPLVVVLDGLEVLREGPEGTRYGTFLDDTLREFLTALCQREHRSLAVLTSRFAIADLERFIGTAFHQLELHGLPREQAAQLLSDLGVGGPADEREYVSEQLDGHPLGLRVFAAALPDEDRGRPGVFLAHAFRAEQTTPDSPLRDKLRRLLVFYENKLTRVQTLLLGVVALFRTPVADETVLRLARGLLGAGLEGWPPDDAALTSELRWLHARGMLAREPVEGGHGSVCHPVLRGYFRAALIRDGAGIARRAADLLTGQPADEPPRSVKDVEPVLLAIELLLESGNFTAARELYRSRLQNGQIFLTIPAPSEGVACALGFVRDDERRRQCAEKLSKASLGFFLNGVALFAMWSGYFELAQEYYNDSNLLTRELRDDRNLSVGLRNESELRVILGELVAAHDAATEAISSAVHTRYEPHIRQSYACRGWPSTFSGRVRLAAEDFALANELEKKLEGGRELYSFLGVRWAELLLRCGHRGLARRRSEVNLRICESSEWNANIARCRWVLGWCALADGRLDEAEDELRQAESIFQRAHLLFDLSRLHVTAGELALARRDAAGAAERAAEALTLAATRGIRLVHADALVLRGRTRLMGDAPGGVGGALDDAAEALRLARECNYAWAERDALLLTGDARAAHSEEHRRAGNGSAASREHEAAQVARAEAESRAARLVLSDEDLAAADAKAADWLAAWAGQAR